MSYSKQNFRSGDTLYASQLNAMDDEIAVLEAEVESTKNMVGSPLTASTAAGMSDQTKIYVYTGSETGYTAGHWYYYNGTAWTDGGVYNSVAVNTDASLTVQGQAADSKAVGDAIDDLDSDLTDVKGSLNEIEEHLEVFIEESTNKYNPSLQTSSTISPHYWVDGAPYSSTQFDEYYNCTALIPVKPNTTYTIGLVGTTPVNPWSEAGQRGWSFDSNGNYISGSGWSSNTFTTPANASYIRFNYYISAETVSLEKLNTYCMLVEGSTLPNEYSPYYHRSIKDEIDEIEQILEDADLDELTETLDGIEDRLTDVEDELIDESTNKYDPSLQTSETISPHYWVNGAPYSSTQFDGSYNCTALIPVKPNTTYTVGLVGANPVNPWNTAGQRGWSFDSDGNFISGSGWSSNTFTTPSNAAYIRFNYYKAGGMVSLERLNSYCMLVEGTTLPNEYSPYYNKTIRDIVDEKSGCPIRVIVDNAGTTVSVISKYSTQYDQMVKVGVGGGNGLVDFRGFYTINNPTDELSQNGSSAVAYLETSGDWHAPFIVAASQNADGDQPSNQYFTGGNHQYNNTGSGSTPTARVANIKFLLDNRELSSGDNKCGRVLEIKWNNYVQAYNTTKSDGTGREVLKEEHSLIFDGRSWESYVSLIPLENISIGTWYGFQLMGLNTVFQNIRYIGATNRGLYNYATASNCGDSATNEMQCYGATHKEILRIDPTCDLGDFTHIGTNKSLFAETYGKAYAYLIASTAMEEGSIWSAHATYKFIPVS